jgi:hypothetical protein
MGAPTPNEVYRDFETPGSTIEHEPRKPDIRALLNQMQGQIDSASGTAQVFYTTKAALDADLAHAAGTMAMVFGDPVATNNGYYQKSGASGAGAWTRVKDLDDSVILLTPTGGTANAIVASAAPEWPAQPGRKLFKMTPTSGNSGATTVEITGVATYPVTTATGDPLVGGELTGGAPLLMSFETDHLAIMSSGAVGPYPAHHPTVLYYKGTLPIMPRAVSLDGRFIDYHNFDRDERIIDGINSDADIDTAFDPLFAALRAPQFQRPGMFDEIVWSRASSMPFNVMTTHRERTAGVNKIYFSTTPGRTFADTERPTIGGLGGVGYNRTVSETLTAVSNGPGANDYWVTYPSTNGGADPNEAKTADAGGYYSPEGKCGQGAVLTWKIVSGEKQYIIVAPPSSEGKLYRRNLTTGVESFDKGGLGSIIGTYGKGARAFDRRVFFPPASNSADGLLIYNPDTDTCEFRSAASLGVDFTFAAGEGSVHYTSLVADATGRALYGGPRQATTILIVTPVAPGTDAAVQTTMGLTLNEVYPVGHAQAGEFVDKWSPGVLHPSGKIAYGPFVALDLLVIDTLAHPSATAVRTDFGTPIVLNVGVSGGRGQWMHPGLMANGLIVYPCFDTVDFLCLDLRRGKLFREAFGMVPLIGKGQYTQVLPLPSSHGLAIPLDAEFPAWIDPVTLAGAQFDWLGEGENLIGHEWNTAVIDPINRKIIILPQRETHIVEGLLSLAFPPEICEQLFA